MSNGFSLNFVPPGAVASAFMLCLDVFAAIMGPVGSGKTFCAIQKLINTAALQPRSPVDGVRYSKILVVRDEYPLLYKTTIPSWWKVFPKSAGEWTGSEGRSATHHLRFRIQDGSIMDLQVLFIAIGEQSIEDVARGFEFNMAWLNEADRLSRDVLMWIYSRIVQGRYPGLPHVAAADCVKQIIADYNAPDTENYLYKLFEEGDTPPGYRLFKQPGGLHPNAENRAHVTRESYEAMAATQPDWFVRRMVHNQYGYSRDGKPVYTEYRDDFHASSDVLMPVRDLPVRVDFDQGLHPACLLRQNMPDGQLRWLDELYSDGGAVDLCDQLRRLIGSAKYAGCRVIGGKGDPMIVTRSGNDAESWADVVNRLMGWTGHSRLMPAQTNDPDKRQGVVRYRLKTNTATGQPGLLVSSTCKIIRKGFNSTYRFKAVMGRQGEYRDIPDKIFPVADLHDAGQYGAMDDGGFEEVVGRVARGRGAFGSKSFKARVEVRV
jgi:hypothetical protein